MRDPFCPHCGVVLHKKRSAPQHRLFFASIQEAFNNWPIEGKFLPQSAEHLRAWLLVQAGHFDVIGQNLSESPGDIFRMVDFSERCLERARATGSAGFVEITGRNSIVVKFPRSINWRELDQRAFAPIAQAVFEIIQEHTGIAVEDLKREAQAA